MRLGGPGGEVLGALGDLDVYNWVPGLRFPTVAIATFVVTVICATISFYALERPLMRWGKRRARAA